MACLNLLESDAKPKLKVHVYVGLTFCVFFWHSFGPEFWLLIGDTFLLLTPSSATPGFAQTFTRPMYICVRARACVCVRARACVCVCVCVSFHLLLSDVKTNHLITQLLYTLVSIGGTFFLDKFFTIYNLSSLCMLTANGFFYFWPGVFTSCLGGAIPC